VVTFLTPLDAKKWLNVLTLFLKPFPLIDLFKIPWALDLNLSPTKVNL
jgi:hypothetical protein